MPISCRRTQAAKQMYSIPPKGASAFVRKNKDYWIPSFGGGYKLDDTRGEEKIYLIVSPSPNNEIV